MNRKLILSAQVLIALAVAAIGAREPLGIKHSRSYWTENQETADQELFQDIIPFV